MELGPGDLYLGRTLDGDEPVIYPADDLTTHGVIVGMTGSGKTGLGIGLIEEALLHGIPCLVIDPKGDMGNLALNFPDLRGGDFEPWIDQAAAVRDGRTVAEVAAATADTWRKGLSGHGIAPERMRRLREAAQIVIYTPGSAAGVGIDVLGSLDPPDLDWTTDAEVIRDEIQSVVSSLLVLAGIVSDPVSGPEHILVSTIIETLWKQGKGMDLATLIGQIPKPPFRRLGVFDVDSFISEKDRMSLALKLNGLLASPSFASWLHGVPLDIETMIGTPQEPRAAVVYLTHLNDEERQFLVTLLLSKMVTWIRSLPGTSQLRALIYMDEMFGFAPPTASPPSKKPILTIMKQARAHGVGMVVSTQNPVDLDYKAMSNAGTWMVGRLRTENDKRRILEGLASASGAVDIAQLDRLITDLGKRQFVLHSTKGPQPVVFGTRWAMSYLAGPLTRDQVATLMADRKPEAAPSASPTGGTTRQTPLTHDDIVAVAPPVAQGVGVFFLDPGAPWGKEVGADPTGSVMQAAVAATVGLLYDDTAAGIDHRESFEAVIFPLAESVTPDRVIVVDHDVRDFATEPPDGASYRIPDLELDTKAFWNGLEASLKDYLVAHRPATVFRNPALGLYSRVDETEEGFRARCAEAAETAADIAVAKLTEKYRARIERVKGRIATAESRLYEAEETASARKQEELMSGAGDLLGALLGGRSRSNPLGRVATRRSRSRQAEARAETAAGKVFDLKQDLIDLEEELADAVAGIVDEHTDLVDQMEEVAITLEKNDISVELKLVWVPVG